jgi:hypothetical protein
MSSENSSSQFTTLLKYYESVKNTVTTYASNFFANGSNKFYVRTGVMLSTILAMLLRFLTSTMLNYVYFLNNVINTVRYLGKTEPENQEQPVEQVMERLDSSNRLLKSWTTLSSVVMFSTLLSYFSDWMQSPVVSFCCEVVKYFVYYKLMTDMLFSQTLSDKLSFTYVNNRIGVDSVQNMGHKVMDTVLDAFSEDSRNDLVMVIKKVKSN